MPWVNVFAHGPLRRAAVNSSVGQYGVDSVMTTEPPLARQYFPSITAGAAQSSSASLAPSGTELIWYEVQPGYTVGYERANQNGTLRTADAQSPTIEGKGFLAFGPGWQLSLIDRS